jgi:hypothetical protein
MGPPTGWCLTSKPRSWSKPWKKPSPVLFSYCHGGGHNLYFWLTFNAAAGNFDADGGGIGLFEDRAVEPLIFAFFRHYLWGGVKRALLKEAASPSSTAPSAVGQNGP